MHLLDLSFHFTQYSATWQRPFDRSAALACDTQHIAKQRIDLQVVTLGDPKLVERFATDELDRYDTQTLPRGAASNGIGADSTGLQAYVSDNEAGGLTYQGLMVFLRKLPFMHGLRELRVHGIGASLQNQHDVMRLLAAGIASLRGLQVCLRFMQCTPIHWPLPCCAHDHQKMGC